MDTAVALVEREKYHDVIELAEHLANERILDILYPEEKKSNSKQDEKLKNDNFGFNCLHYSVSEASGNL